MHLQDFKAKWFSAADKSAVTMENYVSSCSYGKTVMTNVSR